MRVRQLHTRINSCSKSKLALLLLRTQKSWGKRCPRGGKGIWYRLPGGNGCRGVCVSAAFCNADPPVLLFAHHLPPGAAAAARGFFGKALADGRKCRKDPRSAVNISRGVFPESFKGLRVLGRQNCQPSCGHNHAG